MRRKHILRTASITLILAIVAGLGWKQTRQVPAPDVVFTVIDGSRIDMAAQRGNPVLVKFWATSCRACVAEMPGLASMYRDLSVRGLKMVAVAMPYDSPMRVVAMAKSLPYPVALDPLGKIAKAFGDVQRVPTTFLVSPEGRIDKTTRRTRSP